MSEIRQNYSTEAETFVNRLANLHMQIVFTYLSMSFYFTQENGFPESVGFFFLRLAKEKHQGMQKLLELQNDRGGIVIFYAIPDPPQDEWGTILQGMETALALEKKLNQSFLELHEIGMVHKDPHLCYFLSSFLDEEVKLIKEIGDQLSVLGGPDYFQTSLTYCFIEKLIFSLDI